VSIIVQFRVMDPKLAIHAVEKYEDRLYSDVQLAARRSLASMTLEDILTNRNRLSEDILSDVKATAASYGVTIQRADVKDLVFPGNLQEIMNKVLAAERMSQVQLVEARTKADVQKIESQAKAEAQRIEAEVRANAQRLEAQGDAADVLSLSFLLAICHRMLIKSDIDARISITTELSQCLKLQHSQQRRVFAWACAVRSRSCKRRISASVSRRCTSARKRPFTVSLFPVPDRTISRGLLQREQERLKT